MKRVGTLEKKLAALESEVFDLRRGVWRDKRRAMSVSIDGGEAPGPTSPGSKFDDVDLSGGPSYFGDGKRRQSRSGGGRERSESLLSDDEDDGFDEEAFRQAQEEEGRKRLERVKEVKRGLKSGILPSVYPDIAAPRQTSQVRDIHQILPRRC